MRYYVPGSDTTDSLPSPCPHPRVDLLTSMVTALSAAAAAITAAAAAAADKPEATATATAAGATADFMSLAA